MSYRTMAQDKSDDTNSKSDDTTDKSDDTKLFRYKDNRVVANGYFSVYRNEFINFSIKKIPEKIDYDFEIDFF